MKNKKNQIKKKIKKKISLESIDIIDNSVRHKNHASFHKDKLHLILKIESKFLKSLKRLEAEKLIFSTIKKEFEEKIHALEIRLK